MRRKQHLVRIAGVSLGKVGALDLQRQLYKIGRVIVRLQQYIGSLKRRIDFEMYQFIQANQENPYFHSFIKIKRDVFNDRLPKDVSGWNLILEHGSPLLVSLLQRWEALLLWKLKLDHQGRNQMVDDEQEQYKLFMRSIYHEEHFLKGLSIASPSTLEAFQRAEKEGFQKLTTRQRKLQTGILKYFTRSVCKTSPFSFFGMIATGSFIEQDSTDRVELPMYSHSRVNQALLCMVTEENDDAETFVVNPNLWVNGEEVSILQRIEGNLSQILFKSAEKLLKVSIDRELHRIFTTAKNLVEWSRQELREVLASHDAEQDTSDESVDDTISALLQLQILLPKKTWALYANGPHVQDQKLLHLIDLSSTVGKQGADERLKTLKRIEKEVQSMSHQFGQGARRLVPLYDDVFIPETIHWKAEDYRNLLTEMELWHQLIPLFDLQLRERLIFGEVFRQKWGSSGECNDFPELVETLLSFKNQQYHLFKQLTFNPFQDPILSKLNELYLEFCRELERQKQESVLHLKREFLQSLVDRIPQVVRSFPQSFMMFVQPSCHGEGYLNNILSGFGRCFTRYSSFGQTLQRVKEDTAELYAHSVQMGELVELYEQFGYNGNVHPIMSERFVDYSGLSGSGSAIRLKELVFFYDSERGIIRMKTMQHQEVLPIHLGQLAFDFTPIAYKLLATLSHSDSVSLALPNLFVQSNNGEQEVIVAPEVRIDKLVLSRKRWRLKKQVLEPLLQCSDWDGYVQLLFFFRKHRMPTTFFMRPQSDFAPNSLHKMDDYFKPQYINLENFQLFKLLKKNLQEYTGNLFVEPVSPMFGEALKIQGQKRLVEWGIEFYNSYPHTEVDERGGETVEQLC